MSLRSWNDKIRTRDVLTAISVVATPQTQLAASGGDIFVDDKTSLRYGSANFPCLLIEEDQTLATRRGPRSWKKSVMITLTYMDVSDFQPDTDDFDTVWRAIDDDIQRVAANLEDDSTLTSGSLETPKKPVIETISRIQFSPYGERVLNSSDFAQSVIQRFLYLEVMLLNYVSAR